MKKLIVLVSLSLGVSSSHAQVIKKLKNQFEDKFKEKLVQKKDQKIDEKADKAAAKVVNAPDTVLSKTTQEIKRAQQAKKDSNRAVEANERNTFQTPKSKQVAFTTRCFHFNYSQNNINKGRKLFS